MEPGATDDAGSAEASGDGPANGAAVATDPWRAWRSATPARIALGRVGAGMPTDETLRFGLAHALSRDAVHAPIDAEALGATLAAAGWQVEQVASRAADRATYLRRPDLGRRLEAADAERLSRPAAARSVPPPDVSIVVADGLSALAAMRHAVPLLEALRSRLPESTRYAPVVVARQARVALADEVGECFGARLALILIGERPGLSSPDSLGLYLTHEPRVGRHDAERNCISNVRPEGLSYDAAAFKLAWLMRAALRSGQTGVGLKDESDLAVLDAEPAPVRSRSLEHGADAPGTANHPPPPETP